MPQFQGPFLKTSRRWLQVTSRLSRGVPTRQSRTLQTGLLVLLTTMALGCGASPVLSTYVGEDRVESFMQRDYTRFYTVHVPERTELGPAAPLVLAFHGSSQNGAQFRAQSGLDEAADSAGFIVVYLEAAVGAWDIFGSQASLGLDEIGYVREVIDRVDRAFVMDRDRVIAVGLSNGGVMSQQLGCKLADRIAGFVSVAASMSRPLMEQCTPSRPVSTLFILGSVDPFFPEAGNGTLLSTDGTMEYWAGVNDCPGNRVRSLVPDLTDDDDGTDVYRSRYRPCRHGTRTELDSIVGGGHAWPDAIIPAPASFGLTTRDISANTEIARFLDNLPGN